MDYKNKIIEPEIKIEIKDLKAIETKYNFSFPKEFIDFYLEYNGGELEKYMYIRRGKRYAFNYFYPIKYTSYSLEEMIAGCDTSNMPQYLIPFGVDPGGDQFCFSIKPGEEGEIYYVEHEVFGGGKSKKGVHVLAKNLVEFINNMVE